MIKVFAAWLCLAAMAFAGDTTSLISWWALDEASGNALDSHGSNTLTETSGTIASVTGKVSNARNFAIADTEYFTIADNTDLSTGDVTFSMCCWVKLTSTTAGQAFMSKYTSGGNEREYMLWLSGGGSFRISLSADGSNEDAALEDATSPSTGTWYFLAAGHNASTNEVWISVNAATPTTTSYSLGVNDSGSEFCIGARGGPTTYADAAIDEATFWKRDIRADLAELYNSGSGVDYATFAGGGVLVPIISSELNGPDPILRVIE